MEAKKDEAAASAIPQLMASCSSSTSFCSCDDGLRKEDEVTVELRRSGTEEFKEETDRVDRVGVGDGVDDGYHTPTSPEHRIQASQECPLAPKKRLQSQSRRKARAGGAGRSSRVRREIVFDISVELGEFLQKNKKARREAAIAK